MKETSEENSSEDSSGNCNGISSLEKGKEEAATVKLRRSVSLIKFDSLLLCLDYLQLLSVILSMSLSWAWPVNFIKGTSFIFFANLDIWEFVKVHTVYQGRAQAFADPNTISFSYLIYCLVWLLALTVIMLTTVACNFITPRFLSFGPLNTILFKAKLTYGFLVLLQVSCLPFGITFVRLFDCQYYINQETGEQTYRSIVLQNTLCWSSSHLSILIPLIFVALGYFIVVPTWLILKIREELNTSSNYFRDRKKTNLIHERQLLLKEAEFILGLDVIWAMENYSFFSSFRRTWVLFVPLNFINKAILLSLFGGLYYLEQLQSAGFFLYIFIVGLVILLNPVYRLTIFNFMLLFSLIVHLCNLLVGTLLVLEVQNALLYGQNLLYILLVINLSWVFVAGLWFFYLYLRSLRCFVMRHGPLWPILSDLNPLIKLKNHHTLKYFLATLQARRVLEMCYSYPKLFTPVHKLSRKIKIINAYCREAEMLENIMHESLMSLLMEMVDVYNLLAPQSLFIQSEHKSSYFSVVYELLVLMPHLQRRLEQREKKFILVTPLKKRILLKLFVISVFMEKLERITVVHAEWRHLIWEPAGMAECSISDNNMPTCYNSLQIPIRSAQSESIIKDEEFLLDIEKWERTLKQSADNGTSTRQSSGTGTRQNSGTRQSSGTETRQNSGTRQSSGAGTRQSSGAGTRQNSGTGTRQNSGTRQSSGTETRQNSGTRQSSGAGTRQNSGTGTRQNSGTRQSSGTETRQNSGTRQSSGAGTRQNSGTGIRQNSGTRQSSGNRQSSENVTDKLPKYASGLEYEDYTSGEKISYEVKEMQGDPTTISPGFSDEEGVSNPPINQSKPQPSGSQSEMIEASTVT